MTEVATNNVEMWTVVDVNAAPEKNESADHIDNVDAKDAAKNGGNRQPNAFKP